MFTWYLYYRKIINFFGSPYFPYDLQLKFSKSVPKQFRVLTETAMTFITSEFLEIPINDNVIFNNQIRDLNLEAIMFRS